ncbi:uncharacterized protein LOC128262512 [Drosophila gunungcola]|uniref:Uncharacterized protein n=1 Tax=Drosophila gunungcola TaxID=103775 RepID=A0A9Q0BSJ8_9MUSC|nr:uncharacterized protein LOC128262512 [Drosophila gunungcola]KAI8042350.1 hypothetical protein M5D96_003662 [Drosophila gunungcola]
MCIRCDVDMAIPELKLIGVVLFLVAGLEAQETPVTATESAPTTELTGETSTVTTAETTIPDESTITESTKQPVKVPENAGDPFVKPGKHRPGLRHVRAHDGFHNLKTEKYWAHWNDAFTSALMTP